MKIGIVIDRLNVGGVEKIAIEQVKALQDLGEDASLVVLRKKAVVQNAFPDLVSSIPIIYLDQRLPRIFRGSFQFPVFHFFSLFHLTYPFFLPFVVKRREFDYFIVHGTYTCLSAIMIKKIKKIHFSAFIWDPASYILERVYSEGLFARVLTPLKKLALVLDGFLINRMDNVLVGGRAHNDFIHSINPTKPIVVIYPSVHPIVKPLKKDKYAVMVTAWKRGKHPEYIIEIARAIPKLQIKMVGKWLESSYREEFENLLFKNNLTEQIEVVGEVSELEMSNLIARAKVLLQTNDDRGFGMPALEAAGCATTFIIPRGQGVCELFTDQKDGYYTKEKDTKTIAKLINRIMEDDNRATVMGTRAWKKVVDNYSWERHAKQLVNLVKKSPQV